MTGLLELPPMADDSESPAGPRRGKAPVPPAPPPDKEILTTVEAAGYLGVPVRTVQREVRLGHLKARKVGKEFRFHRDALRAWVRGDDADGDPEVP